MVKTLFEKVWDAHIVAPETDNTPAVLYIDTHLIHEVTSPQAFDMLRSRGLKVRRPDRTFATMDHSTPTTKPGADGEYQFNGDKEKQQVAKLKNNCEEFGITLFELGDDRQGIVHVVGPEQGITQPGKTIVCGDSHTSTHGAFGALAFGIGTSEVGYTFTTQCIPQRKPKTMGIRVDGQLSDGVSAKDLILAIIAKIGIGGATGHVIEYFGEAIRRLNMDERMTICNMSIEAGARAGMIAPDQVTFDYLKDRPYAPEGEFWDKAVEDWSQLYTDEGAEFDQLVVIQAEEIRPMITFGTNPEMAIPITSVIPEGAAEHALDYMGFKANQSMINKPVDVVFIGSCTNSRITDLRAAAEVLKDQRVAKNVRTLIVPGSHLVKQQAEKEGLNEIFTQAGAEWREPGCSMCLGMNGDIIQPGQICVSTSNRNFEGRQGKGGRTLLASPATAAAAAITGKVVDPSQINTMTLASSKPVSSKNEEVA
ncbi:3-isopropylmalate dehydratase large subunit [Aliikangiella coralliicola]|uniref:3-isopropylmalate dehydratase large subunit n=1 Tax=Aliikangiella coralliicola TaxID=2592383 RepID=A0A545UK46_9GAMM|nr:3-isopropylmalate dehydratase large subunit [Aliikangiella coralliicola]TQV89842.1 3-isopropylmalate dehydratase large subunit [Aliikangiella coralliicola]